MIDDARELLLNVLQGLIESVIGALPTVVMGTLLIIVALCAAKLVEVGLRAILRRLRLDSLVQRTGIDDAIRGLDLHRSLSEFLPRVAYFLLLFLFARTAADSLGLDAISQALGSFLAYLPNLVAAVVILLSGSVAAQIAGKAVETAASNSGIDFASSLGTMVTVLITFVLGIMAIGQRQIDVEMIRLVTAGLLATFAIAFGLSFGLGSRDITRNVLAGLYSRRVFDVGAELDIGGERGVLASITPTQTVLERDGLRIAVANRVFLEQVIKQHEPSSAK